MKIGYQILKEKKLLILRFSGHFDLKKYLPHVAKITSLPEWKDISKILSDFTPLILSFDKNILDQLIKSKAQLNIHNKTHVYLVNTPKETALMHLYIEKTGEKKYNYCTTIQKALDYLDLSEHQKEISETLELMKRED